MAIILPSERKLLSSRIIFAVIYLLLAVGGISMVYPFLLMVSGSMKSKVDSYDLDIIPAFLTDDTVLFRKYIEEKYDERIQDYRVATKDYAPNFLKVVPPGMPSQALLNNWREFTELPCPNTFYNLGFSTTTIAAHQKVIPKNLRAFIKHLKEICDGSIEVYNTKFSSALVSWFLLEVKTERLMDKNYNVPPNKVFEEFYVFKRLQPTSDRVYLSCDGKYSRYCMTKDRYKNSINLFNELNETSYNSFEEIVLPEKVPAGNQRKDWERFVREELNRQFIVPTPDSHQRFVEFLQQKYEEIKHLNKMYSRNYSSFQDVPFPADKAHSSPALLDFSLFVEDDKLLPASEITLDTPEVRWRTFLKSKYEDLAAVSSAHKIQYRSFSAIPMPQKQADYAYCMENSRSIRMHFITRNYKMVIEYISMYGRGILNTVIYCTLAILAALIVNPLAAYALSRYRMPNQYKLLLFFIATMAFPAMVNMIPNYLLMKNLGLLNTFGALILPGMANGYAIFLLKGFFDSLPRELYEAADIDGATEWHKFWIITMNLSKPILAVIALGAFMGAYSNFMFAFILCPDVKMWTLMVWLYQLQFYCSRGVVFASLIIAAIPTLFVFICAQNVILRGIVVPTEK